MLAEDPNERDDLYDDVPMEDDEKLPIAHVMVTGKRGRPYLEEYELVPFPKGFVPPKPAIHANILLSTGPSVAI